MYFHASGCIFFLSFLLEMMTCFISKSRFYRQILLDHGHHDIVKQGDEAKRQKAVNSDNGSAKRDSPVKNKGGSPSSSDSGFVEGATGSPQRPSAPRRQKRIAGKKTGKAVKKLMM